MYFFSGASFGLVFLLKSGAELEHLSSGMGDVLCVSNMLFHTTSNGTEPKDDMEEFESFELFLDLLKMIIGINCRGEKL